MKEITIVIPFKREPGQFLVGVTRLTQSSVFNGYGTSGFVQVPNPPEFLPSPQIEGYSRCRYLATEQFGDYLVNIVVAMATCAFELPTYFLNWQTFVARVQHEFRFGTPMLNRAPLEPTSRMVAAILLASGFEPGRDLRISPR